MNLTEIFKDAITYPSKNIKILLILGVLLLASQIVSGLRVVDTENAPLGIILSILTFIISIFVSGYLVSDLKSTLDLNDEMPEFDIKNNFIDGIKYFVIQLVYAIIMIVLLILFILLAYVFAVYLQIPALVFLFAILALLSIIAVAFFSTISYPRFADTGSIGEALNFKEVWNDIEAIGKLNLLSWVILLSVFIGLMLLVIFVVAIEILLIVSYVEILTIIFAAIIALGIILLFTPFISLFENRAIGLLYLEKDD
ncbi:DUF4013 domain-containing protein [Methanobrevibacter sp. DSM 116169]|uniref:DUF4013 domain-containing protein n=1 Tax=Methanobrevibacter sp. DSM 116169 TaxID=3242727 RepID=UPI0038FBF04A